MLSHHLPTDGARARSLAAFPSALAALTLLGCAAVAHDDERPAEARAIAAGLLIAAVSEEQPAPPHPETAQHAEVTAHDHCTMGEPPDPRDALLTGEPDRWRSRDDLVDLALPPEVLTWMSERGWEVGHDAWHNVRRCTRGGRGLFNAGICQRTELVSAHRECSGAQNGREFLTAHRHMIQHLRQAFPAHPELFASFERFPFEAADVPEEWRGRFGTGFSEAVKASARILEDIESNLALFPTDGDLGRFIQCNGAGGGVHGAMHFKWQVSQSPANLGNQSLNLRNFMFWKLHGWIDDVWERYRVAKGLRPDEPALVSEIAAQCREMDVLWRAVKELPKGVPQPTAPQPAEAGAFHDRVRPILEKTCSGCHNETSPEGSLVLGGQIRSAEVVRNLVDVQAVHGGQFKRVEPGAPERSWLYLKAAGLAATSGCAGPDCNVQVMPPTGGDPTLTPAELEVLRQWIADGAEAPTTR